MAEEIERPQELRVNAWTGTGSPQQTLPSRTPWSKTEKLAKPGPKLDALAEPVDDREWWHPEVGWGLVLPDNEDLLPAELARADEQPRAIQKLLESRKGAPVLRWRKDLQQGYLRRYYANGSYHDLSVQAPWHGIAEKRIPQYILIYASPEEIPWTVQYALNMSTFVGRLDLEEPELDCYVDALISDWEGQICNPYAPVVWSVDDGKPDITWLMARAIGTKLWEAFKNDKGGDFKQGILLNEETATNEQLAAALGERTPGLIVTTSHGMTPLNDPETLRSQLGAPVDSYHRALSIDHLKDWQASGAIWYAHACCSAGSDRESRYEGMLPRDGPIASMLEGIAVKAGAMVAPLARALLGAERPLRAFVGHVEPTFDWTLRDPLNKQVLTSVLQSALYNKLFQSDGRNPIGWALKGVYEEAGSFYGAWQRALPNRDGNVSGGDNWALYRQLVAMDRQTLVILGDPTVSLPRSGRARSKNLTVKFPDFSLDIAR
jgi:hypothetical protein